MADRFNLSPSEFINMNDLFPVLNDKVGLTYEQWRKAIENINYVYQHLGVSEVRGDKAQVIYTEVGTEPKVEITPREVIVDDKKIVYLDFVFSIPKVDEYVDTVTEKVVTTTGPTGSITGKGTSRVTITPIANTGNKENGVQFDFLREFLPYTNQDHTVIIKETGITFKDNLTGDEIRPTINGNEVAYMSDITTAIQSAINDSWEASY